MKKFLSIAIALILTLLCSAPAHAISEIKIAILAPEGSAWHKVISAWSDELSKKTSG